MPWPTIQGISRQLACTPLFGDWRMLWIDEANAIPPVAQVRILTLPDDRRAAPRSPALATASCEISRNASKPALRPLKIAPPTSEEIIALLRRYLPDEPEVVNAAAFADGNVRQALLDAKGLVQRNTRLAVSSAERAQRRVEREEALVEHQRGDGRHGFNPCKAFANQLRLTRKQGAVKESRVISSFDNT